LETKYVFGYRGDVKNNIFIVDEKIMYPAGHNIVSVSYESKDAKYNMKIRNAIPETKKITCMTVHNTKNHKLLAYAM